MVGGAQGTLITDLWLTKSQKGVGLIDMGLHEENKIVLITPQDTFIKSLTYHIHVSLVLEKC
jgi:hypothetical protein